MGSSSRETWWKIHQPLCWSMGIDTAWQSGGPEQDGTDRQRASARLGLTQRSPRAARPPVPFCCLCSPGL